MTKSLLLLPLVRGFSGCSSSARCYHRSTALQMVRTKGLEQRTEGATPTEGGMTLYLKAAEDGTSVGDCPFAHFVRMVLEEKGLEYDVQPATQDTKPTWLLEHYEGKMPALRHRKECYVDSGVIAEYLEFFFPTPSLKVPKHAADNDELLDGFFPAVAQYLKEVEAPNDEKLQNLLTKLSSLNDHLAENEFLCGEKFTMLDCRLAPQLYHLQTGIVGFKNGTAELSTAFPNVQSYIDRVQARPSFQTTSYPQETILWGWSNARK